MTHVTDQAWFEIMKFWKGEPEGRNLFQEVFPSECLFDLYSALTA